MGGGGQDVARRSGRRLGAQGMPVCDLTTATGSAAVASPVPVGGGSAESFSYFPPAEGSSALVGRTVGSFPQLVPLAPEAWPPAAGNGAGFVKDAPNVAANDDYPRQWTPDEPVLVHQGFAAHITKEGQAILHSGQPIRVQLATGAYLRVSLDGAATEEHLVLAGPMVEAHNGLVDKTSELADRVDQLETAVNSLMTALNAALGGTATTFQALLPTLYYKKPYTRPSAVAEDDMGSAAFVVSSDTVASAATGMQG